MAIEGVLLRLLLGIRDDAVILTLNLQGGSQRANLSWSVKKKENYKSSSNLFDQTQTVICDVNRFPYANNRFEAIVLKGTIAKANLTKEKQERIFQDIIRLLKPDGIIYLAIENKLSPAFWAKSSGSLPSKLNRLKYGKNTISNALQLIRSTKNQQRKLLLFKTYLNLMKKFGFKKVLLYAAPHGFNDPCILSLEKTVYNYYSRNLDSPRKSRKQFLIRLLNIFGANKFFSYSYVLVGRKGEK